MPHRTIPVPSGDLRHYLSHDWQEAGQVCHRIFETLGIKMRPQRLSRTLQSHYPNVQVEGPLIRLQDPQPQELP